MPGAKKKRFNVEFAGKALEALEKLSTITGDNFSDVIRKALVISQFIEEAKANGEKLLLEKKGNIREVWIK